jgi:hypothetical protein
MKNEREILLNYVTPKKTMSQDRISARLKFAIVEIVIRKLKDGCVGPEIFDKFDNSAEILDQNAGF